MSLSQIIYSSFPTYPISDAMMEGILRDSQEKNAQIGISGILFFNGSLFVQMLEGPEEAISSIFHKISKDHRHHSVTVLLKQSISHRTFPGWDMKFNKTHVREGLQALAERMETAPDSAVAMIRQFAKFNSNHTQSPVSESPLIMIIDDDANSRTFLSSALDNRYRVTSAASGDESLQVLKTSIPDLILLDADTPEINEFEVCAQLKFDHRTRDIPVIFLSEHNEVRHKVNGLEIGGADYITKPFQMAELHARIDSHLEIVRLRQDLQKSMEEMQEKNKRLDMFARTLAHDLRNPLSSITAGISYLKMELDETSPELLPVADIIETAGENLQEIIDSLLLLAISEHQNVTMCLTDPSEIGELCRDDLADMTSQYKGEIQIEPDMAFCEAHSPWLRRIFTNLFSNGLKYGGENPRVTLSASYCETGRHRYSVSDRGVGMSADQTARLFNEFTRLAPEVAPGIGLGLVLVKNLVKQMKGEISVESTLGRGTVFHVDLPAASRPRTSASNSAGLELVS